MGANLGDGDGPMLYQKLCEQGVSFRVGHDVVRFDRDNAVLSHLYSDQQITVGPHDGLVVAAGQTPASALADALSGTVEELHVVGAANAARFIFEATVDGGRVGRLV